MKYSIGLMQVMPRLSQGEIAGNADRGGDLAQIHFSNPCACKTFSDDEHLRAVFSDTISTIFKMSLRHIAQRL
jgi:hypothetical protein